jgi:hypothetical protein
MNAEQEPVSIPVKLPAKFVSKNATPLEPAWPAKKVSKLESVKVPVPTVGVFAHAGVENVADMANKSMATVLSLCTAILSFAGCQLTMGRSALSTAARW